MSQKRTLGKHSVLSQILYVGPFYFFLHYFLFYFEVAIRSLGCVELVEPLPVYRYIVLTYSPEVDLYA